MAKEKAVKEKEEAGEPRVYELGFLLLPTVPEEEVAVQVARLKEFFQKDGGVFVSEEFPKKLGLAYPIGKKAGGKRASYTTAYLGSFKYEVSPEAVLLLNSALEKETAVLRFLLIETVRESAVPIHRPVFARPEAVKTLEKPPTRAEKSVMSEEELDRTIEELMVE